MNHLFGSGCMDTNKYFDFHSIKMKCENIKEFVNLPIKLWKTNLTMIYLFLNYGKNQLILFYKANRYYVTWYPVNWIAQSILSSPPFMPNLFILTPTNSTSLYGKRSVTLQLLPKDYSVIYFHHRLYSKVHIYYLYLAK